MKKWEYKTTADLFFEEVVELGKQGWELVTILNVGKNDIYWFKREIL